MPLRHVLCDQKTQDILGEGGLAEVAARLWAKDCQTCGRSLEGEPPALCVDDVGEYATAGLHHPRCRPPGWNDETVIQLRWSANLSWTSLSFMIPGRTGGVADPRPAMLLNPGLEMILLQPHQGIWRPGYFVWFTSLGMVPPGPELKLHRPLRDITASLADDLISVSVQIPPGSIYEANATPEVVARARQLHGVVFMVTHELDPDSMYPAPDRAWQDIWHLMTSGRVICGWVGTSQS